jgi:hypothetical protein
MLSNLREKMNKSDCIKPESLHGAQKTKLPMDQQPNEEMGTWTEQAIFKGRGTNGQ